MVFDTELDFGDQAKAIDYATQKGMLVSIGEDVIAVNPENGKRYLLDYLTVYGWFWERL